MEEQATWSEVLAYLERERRRARKRQEQPPLVTVVVVDASLMAYRIALRPDSVAAASIDGQPPSLVVVDELGHPSVVSLCRED